MWPNLTTIKYTLFIYNIVCMFVSKALIGIATLEVWKMDIVKLATQYNVDTGFLMIFLGSTSLLMEIIGCFGILKLSAWTLGMYSILLTVMLLLKFILGATVLMIMKAALEQLRNDLETIWKLRHSSEMPFWNAHQLAVKCCGLNNAIDWNISESYAEHNLPRSCCPSNDKDTTENCTLTTAYSNGCLPATHNILSDSCNVVGIAAIVTSAFEMIAVVLACLLRHGINKQRGN